MSANSFSYLTLQKALLVAMDIERVLRLPWDRALQMILRAGYSDLPCPPITLDECTELAKKFGVDSSRLKQLLLERYLGGRGVYACTSCVHAHTHTCTHAHEGAESTELGAGSD